MIQEENRKITFSKNTLVTIIGMFVAGCVVIGTGLCLWGHTPPMITEFIFDFTLRDGSNPYIENRLFWFVIIAGLAFLIVKHFLKKSDEIALETAKEFSFAEVRVGIIAVMCVFSKIYGKDFSQTLLFFFIVSVVCLLLEKEKQDLFFFNFLLLFFSSLALEYMHTKADTRIFFALVISFFLDCVLLCFVKSKLVINRIILVLQCVIPLCLLVYCKDTYVFHNDIVIIPLTVQLNVFWYGTIIALIGMAILHMVKNWKNADCEINDLLSLSVCIVVAGVQGASSPFSGQDGYVVFDGHHLGEMMISFNQIFDYHLVPYKNFYPVSGGFPIILGGLLRVLGLKLTGANLAIAVYCFIISTLTVVLLSKYYINRLQLVFVSLFFKFAQAYSRTNLILLFALILFLPKLLERKKWWLLTWVILIYISVFYYPLYGFATFVGTLPLGIFQIIGFVKEKEYKSCLNDKIFLLTLFMEILLLLISIPSIVGVVECTLAYFSGNLIANGFPIFGRDEPRGVLTWIPYREVRRVLWWACCYMFPVLGIWIPVQIVLLFIKDNKTSFKNSINLNIAYFSAASLIVSVSYTITRLDGPLLSRTGFVFFPCIAFLFSILFFNCLRKNIPAIIVMGFFCFLSFMDSNCIMNNAERIFSKKLDVQDSYTYISKEKSKKYAFLGEGFLSEYMEETLDYIKGQTDKILELDPNLGILGPFLGFSVALNLKAPCQPSLYCIQSYRATKMLVKSLLKEKPVVLSYAGTFHVNNLKRWLLTTDEYIYSEEYQAFFPKDFAIAHNIKSDDKLWGLGFWHENDMGGVPAIGGKALKSISKSYIENTVSNNIGGIRSSKNENGTNYSEFVIHFEKELCGGEVYCVYLDLDRSNGDSFNPDWIKLREKTEINKDVNVMFSWHGRTDRNFMKCEFSDGRLFVPLGFNADWLLGKHDEIKVLVEGLDYGENITINDCRVYKAKDF